MSGVQAILALLLPSLTLLLGATLEVAFRSASRFDVHRWAQRGAVNGTEEGPNKEAIEAAVTAVRLLRQLSLVCLVVFVARGGTAWIGDATGIAQGVLLSLGLSLAVYLVIDKLLAFGLVAALGPMRVLTYGRPLIAMLRFLFGKPAAMLNRFQRDSRAREEPDEDADEERDLDAFLDMVEEEGLVSEHDEALLRGVADFGEAVVNEVMTPRVDIVSIAETASLGDLRGLVAEHKLSRIPVVRDNIDQVVGVVNIKDLLTALGAEGAEGAIRTINRDALFVPESKRVRDLLREFQRLREHLAIVVDEYGGTAGLVTLEDLLEEIVGEIQDEYEDEEQMVVRLADGVVVAAGKAEIEEIEETLGVEISDDQFETVGGMAFVHFGYVPKPGEEFDRDGLHVEVLEADERRVHRVRITARPSAE